MNRSARTFAVGVTTVLVAATSISCSDDASGETHLEAMRSDPLASADLPGGVALDGFEGGAGAGDGPDARGELDLERRWGVDAFTQDQMAVVMEHVAAHDVYFASLLCEPDFITAAGYKRIGPYPGSVSIRLDLDDDPDAGPNDAVAAIVLRLHSSSEEDGLLPTASYSWQQAGNDPDGAGCDQRLIDIVEESQARQPPSLPVGTATTEPRDLGD